MRQLLKLSAYAAVLIGSLSPYSVSTTQATGVAQELIEIEHRLAKALVDRNLEMYSSILASDWTTIDLAGRVLSKSQVLRELASRERQIEAVSIDDIKVREFGDVALVTGRTTATGRYKGQRSSVVLRFTDVFVKRNGRWQVVASQGTQVVQ
ncbi:MAG TPA: nuclear transport factor 2 family protein [Blastocatellia bacterium]|jgi:ketosteroid isomerase-like protein|nr:nuclear transport factor 2 family protein [Blastocatellia bacterium]